MKLWIPATLAGVIVVAYAYFYFLSTTEVQSAAPLGVANIVGLAAVFLGLIAAGVILRRGTPTS